MTLSDEVRERLPHLLYESVDIPSFVQLVQENRKRREDRGRGRHYDKSVSVEER